MTCARRHVVVTGASSGIGRANALRLAAAGWHVYAGVRPRARYLVGKDAQTLANLVRFVPTSTLDALRRKVFNLPAPGSRAVTPIREGVSR
jgi:NAD(P)-dependent dehydrogenase (short-subunit alcohol dehydrogenase family)